MKISVAQIKPEKGLIKKNIETHRKWIDIAVSKNADLIVFSELSLTGYEPKLAKELAIDESDSALEDFQQISKQHKITIGVGLPTKSDAGIRISMILFSPSLPRLVYSKQLLHSDERPYFEKGNQQIVFIVKGKKIAPAICYESLQNEHSEQAFKLGANIYLASVAKSQAGIEKAFLHYPDIARKYSFPVLMANCIGFCDNFESAGQTSSWDENGVLIGQLECKNEGILIFDTITKEGEKVTSYFL
jgi:predicted amidohydrolase